MTVGALLLAAGQARRFGAQKLLQPIDGEAILVRAFRSLEAAGLPVLLVTGSGAAAVRALLPQVPSVLAFRHAEGMGASIAAGAAAVPDDWEGLLVALGDMPFIRPQTHALLARALEAGAEAVRPVCGGRPGNPAGFARAHLPSLCRLSGDSGARALLARLPVTAVEVDDPGIHQDIDRPDDLPA
ncbi:nucleotidyltransferase family protein [Thermaurantiacus sp.]